MYMKCDMVNIKPDYPELFVDDYLIDTMSKLSLIPHTLKKINKSEIKEIMENERSIVGINKEEF